MPQSFANINTEFVQPMKKATILEWLVPEYLLEYLYVGVDNTLTKEDYACIKDFFRSLERRANGNRWYLGAIRQEGYVSSNDITSKYCNCYSIDQIIIDS